MKKVLVVEDDQDLVKMESMLLKAKGHEVFVAASGDEALEVVGDIVPDLILMDIMLPGKVDGLLATRTIKANAQLSHIPVVLVSAKKSEPENSLYIANADGYLRKPFGIDQFLTIVENCIGQGDI